LLVGLALTASAMATDFSGAGSTFVFPILHKWSAEYEAKARDHLIYRSEGSGAGLERIKAATVDFAASDMPLGADELAQRGLAQFPIVIGGVVPVVNIDGVAPGQLRFSGKILADIYLGRIQTWNDPVILALNPQLKLPDARIAVIHRSDGSGTTFNWVNYLSKVSDDWKTLVGEGTSVAWPIGFGAEGNEGVTNYIGRIRNSIGYVEYAYVLQSNLVYALVKNRAGNFVAPETASFQAAAAVDWRAARDFNIVITDAPGESAYPIAATTFILMYKTAKSPERTKSALDFFLWALHNGQQSASALRYTPLPADLVAQIEAYLGTAFAR
jgi:phosphate transport system substrate-binding protein